jgi:hypothetical protein
MWHLGPLAESRSCICFVFLILSLDALAQVQNGEITGTVADPSGAVVPGAKIVLQNLGTRYEIQARTNAEGIYTAKELNVGNYLVRVEAHGFKTAEASNLILNAGTVLRVDFKLLLGERTDVVEVTDADIQVNTETSRLSQTVDSTQIANLPLNGRNVYDLIQYAPGATNMRGVLYENGANTVVNGVRENFNGFLINGVSNKGLSGGPVNQPIQDTMEEFQLLTLNNSAEFGNSAGAITNLVTKSGSNQFHGSAWEFLRNDVFDANPFFANHFPDPADRKKSPLRLNQFGATLGGPLKKDKVFFFCCVPGGPVPDFEPASSFSRVARVPSSHHLCFSQFSRGSLVFELPTWLQRHAVHHTPGLRHQRCIFRFRTSDLCGLSLSNQRHWYYRSDVGQVCQTLWCGAGGH